MPSTATAATDRSEFRHVLLSGAIVGAVTAAAVVLFLFASRVLPAGIVSSLALVIIVLAGGVLAAFLPGFFAAARTVQGVASAAAIGLWGTIVFMAIDIILLRPFKAYPWTWDDIGGGSTWWYLPIWWMLGTFLAWMGAIVTAGRAARAVTPQSAPWQSRQSWEGWAWDWGWGSAVSCSCLSPRVLGSHSRWSYSRWLFSLAKGNAPCRDGWRTCSWSWGGC